MNTQQRCGPDLRIRPLNVTAASRAGKAGVLPYESVATFPGLILSGIRLLVIKR